MLRISRMEQAARANRDEPPRFGATLLLVPGTSFFTMISPDGGAHGTLLVIAATSAAGPITVPLAQNLAARFFFMMRGIMLP